MATCAILSFGCPKNLVDSEQLLGLLRQHGLEFEPEPERAEVVIINTCGFLEASRQECLDAIHQMEALRESDLSPLRCLVVAGCLVSRDMDALRDERHAVDAFLDVFSREMVWEAVRKVCPDLDTQAVEAPHLARQKPLPELRVFEDCDPGIAPDVHRFPLLPDHVAYLKIAEGCNRRCAFCAIPNIRGRYVSKPMEQVLAEARALVESGVRELVLVAQDTSFYGSDLRDGTSLARLLPQLAELEPLRWIRVLYLYPQNFPDELVEAFAATPKVLPYVDMPLQHINDRILRSMRRAATREETLTLLEKLRARIPNLAIRTAFIVGYPGETRAEFDELLAFVRKQRFERLGVFQYSPEEGTAAASMPDQVPERVARKRTDLLMDAQRHASADWMASHIGEKMEILIDQGPLEMMGLEAGQRLFVGRSRYDAPDIDGHVYLTVFGDGRLPSGEELRPGVFCQCEIVDCDEYDWYAVWES